MTDHDPVSTPRPPSLDESMASVATVAALVREAAPTSFGAGFAGRVLARVTAERELSLSRALERQFIRVVPLVAAASLLLAAYNWWGARGTSSSTFEAALNLPQVSLAAAYSTSSLFGAVSAATESP